MTHSQHQNTRNWYTYSSIKTICFVCSSLYGHGYEKCSNNVEQLVLTQAHQAIVTILKRRKQGGKKEEAMLGPTLDERGEKNPIRSQSPANA